MKKRTIFAKTLSIIAVAALTPSLSAAAERKAWNGHLQGQAPSPMKTDFAVGKNTTASVESVAGFNWNGHLPGQASSPLKTDLSVLPETGLKVKGSGYLIGSMNVWQQDL